MVEPIGRDGRCHSNHREYEYLDINMTRGRKSNMLLEQLQSPQYVCGMMECRCLCLDVRIIDPPASGKPSSHGSLGDGDIYDILRVAATNLHSDIPCRLEYDAGMILVNGDDHIQNHDNDNPYVHIIQYICILYLHLTFPCVPASCRCH